MDLAVSSACFSGDQDHRPMMSQVSCSSDGPEASVSLVIQALLTSYSTNPPVSPSASSGKDRTNLLLS